MEGHDLRYLRVKEHGDEAQFFRRWDAELLKRLRQRDHLEELSMALADKLQVEDPELLDRIIALGVTLDTVPAFLLAPLVQIAWAEGHPPVAQQREAILVIAFERGIGHSSSAYAQLVHWLNQRPSADLFDAAEACIRTALSVLPTLERDARIRAMVSLCRRVAARGETGLARLLGLPHPLSRDEESVLAAISARLNA